MATTTASASEAELADGVRRERTHYDILELKRDASLTDVKKAYRRLAVRHHPDRNMDDAEGATSRFREINEAYEVLSDDVSRKEYDASIDQQRGYGGGYGGGGGGGDNFKWSHRSGGTTGEEAGRRPRRDPFDQFDDVFRNDPFFAESFRSMDDLFASRFDDDDDAGGGDGRQRRRRRRRGGQRSDAGSGAGSGSGAGAAEESNGGGMIWGMVRGLFPNVKINVRTSIKSGGRSSATSRSYGGGPSSSTVTRRSTSTIVQNGRRVTVQSLEKGGNKIEEKYVGETLVERTVNGRREDIGEVVVGGGVRAGAGAGDGEEF